MVRAPRVTRSGIPFVPPGLSGLVNADDISRPSGEGDISSDLVFGLNERLPADFHFTSGRARLSLFLGKMRGGRHPLSLRGPVDGEEQTQGPVHPAPRAVEPLQASDASWDVGPRLH